MMGMTITIEISDDSLDPEIFKKAFDYFEYVLGITENREVDVAA